MLFGCASPPCDSYKDRLSCMQSEACHWSEVETPSTQFPSHCVTPSPAIHGGAGCSVLSESDYAVRTDCYSTFNVSNGQLQFAGCLE